ncbi:hypothetical protein WH96_13745 [Kiloniella spongiae]|uniref:DUF2794 domain-containing protein n=1 Tax=Kiloniella spongiae TaxID=1489064 RepID=A0A0H2MCE7_9PROT|nr:DUF2794 domain-containing protein [Kiloniella spongiae]KLN60239.1 hypothetical protein WH96_13745 [Kiloniella spongiae]
MTAVYYLNKGKKTSHQITFNKHELGQLLSVYSQRVAKGEWRDYAIDMLGDCAIFSIFRHAHETPLFAVVKSMGHKNRYEEYTVFNGHKKLKRTRNLSEALDVFNNNILHPVSH